MKCRWSFEPQIGRAKRAGHSALQRESPLCPPQRHLPNSAEWPHRSPILPNAARRTNGGFYD